MKIILVTITFFLSLLTIAQNEQNIKYLDINKATNSPDSVEFLFLDCATDDCTKIIQDFNQFTNLKGLYISNFDGKAIGESIEQLNSLTTLTIEKSSELNLTKLFSSLAKLTNLKNLSLKDNELTKLPSNIKNLTQLKSINISNNNNLNLEKTIEQLAALNNLEEIYLPVNSITDLPDNIGKLSSLKILDISNNYLEDLPDGISEMRSLEELSIEGNLLQNVTNTLSKAQNINLKYIALDEGLTDKEKKRLKELFPNAEIKEVDADASLDEQIDKIIEENEDSTVSAPIEQKQENNIVKEKETNNINFGEITVEKNKLKIYSQAYAHYPEVFQLRRFSNFDSTMFEERFLDTTYANITKIEFTNIFASSYERIALFESKGGNNNDTYFYFSKYNTSSINRSNPELNAFTGMVWVYKGNLDKKEFKKQILKRKRDRYKWYRINTWGFWYKYKFWTDVRITYNNEKQNFNIKLKDVDGFTDLTDFVAYPVYKSSSRSVEDAQQTYVKRYARYSKSLDRRKNKFEKHNLKDHVQYNKSNRIAEEKRWKSFQKNYMSEAERELTREEWLIYYDKVIANERKAMGNAVASARNIERSINLDGYKRGYLWQNPNIENTGNPTITSVKTLYQDVDSNMLAVKRIIIIDKDDKTYQTYEGSLGIKTIRLNLIQGGNYVFIVQLRNDDIGYIKNDEYQKIKFPKNNKYKFTLKTVNSKFGTVQMVREELNF